MPGDDSEIKLGTLALQGHDLFSVVHSEDIPQLENIKHASD